MIFYAQEEAQKFGEGYVSTEHLLLGLVRESDSVAARVLEKLGVSLNRIRAEVEKQLPGGDARPSQDMTLTPRAKRVIDLAYDEARNLNNNYIGTEHLLLGLIREGDGLAGRVLATLGVGLESARKTVIVCQGQRTATNLESEVAPRRQHRSAYYQPVDAAILLQIRQGRLVAEHLFLMLVASPESEGRMIAERVIPQFESFIGLVENAILYTPPDELPRQLMGDAVERIVVRAQDIAKELGAEHMAPRHLLQAIAEESDSLVGKMLEDHLPDIRNAVHDFEQ